MLRLFSLSISVVFQPLLMPTLVVGMVLFGVPQASSIPEEFKYRLFFLIVLSTLLIPMVTILGLRLSGLVKSLHMAELKDRTIPFLIICLYYILITYFLYQKTELDPVLWLSMAIITSAVIFLTLVTFFWKMSAHMVGAGGFLGVVICLALKFTSYQMVYPLLGAILLSGIVASSRLYLDAHRPAEVYAGFCTGLIICLGGFFWIWS